MVRLNVKPTRMELTTLKKRLKTSTRGHKLLKDKQDELMRQFIALIKENHLLRKTVEQSLVNSMQSFVLDKSLLNEQFIQESFAVSTDKVTVQIDEKNVMSVTTPQMTIQDSGKRQQSFHYGLLNSNSGMDVAIEKLQSVSIDLIKLAEIEKTCQLLADEIEKTRRRVNALEYMIIPQLHETIDYIQMKLEEQERSNLIRMMKVK